MHINRRSRAIAATLALGLLTSIVLAFVPTAGAGAQDAKPTIAITGIDANAGTVEITNHGDAEVDPNGIFLCNFPAYGPIADADVIPAGGSITVDAAAAGVAMDPAGGELGLYTAPEYTNADAIVSYVEWGETGHERAPVAIAAGIWSEGFAAASDGVLSAVTVPPVAPGDWAAATDSGGGTGAEEPTELADTGTDAYWLTLVAAGLVGLGAAFLAIGRRHELT